MNRREKAAYAASAVVWCVGMSCAILLLWEVYRWITGR